MDNTELQINKRIDGQDVQVLVVDDDEGMIDLLRSLLESEGFQVISASTGEDALGLITEGKPDLVLLDMHLPDCNGLEVCKAMKEQRSINFLPVIFVSAVDDTEKKVSGILTGADDYVTKPFEKEELRARIIGMLRLKDAQDRLVQYIRIEKDLLEEMAKKNESLIEISALKDMFIAVASHDLLTPLNVVQTNCEKMLDSSNAQNIPVQYQKAIYKIQSNAFYMTSIIRDLLNNEVKMSSMPVRFSKENIASILRECLESSEVFASEKNIQVEKDIPAEIGPLSVDPVRIREIFNNLIANAIKFTPKGGKIRISAQEGKGQIWVDFEDSGPGISKEEIPKVFVPFKSLANRVDQKGYGLGLYIVKEFVYLHGGEIQVTSEVGKGSCFRIVLNQEREKIISSKSAIDVFNHQAKASLILFGEIAVEKGYVDHIDILSCLDIQQKEAKVGKRRLIGEILLARQLINSKQLNAILDELIRRRRVT